MLTFEINLTNNCNFQCRYCFEKGYEQNVQLDSQLLPQIFSLIDHLAKSESVTICFWGGEPLLQPELVLTFIERYIDNPNTPFMLYTNGSQIKSLLPALLECSKFDTPKQPKFFTQISYDGKLSNDLNRFTRSGQPTSDQVMAAADLLATHQIPFGLKSTIRPQEFELMPYNYLELRELWTHFKTLSSKRIPDTYFPTIEYFNSLAAEDIPATLEKLKKSLITIGHLEKDFYAEHRRLFFRWFSKSRSLCAAGYEMLMCDTNGDLYKCHGNLYSPYKSDHRIGNINDPDRLERISTTRQQHKLHLNTEPKECQECEALYCLRCNSNKHICSKEQEYFARWTDHTSSKDNCPYYKLSSEIFRQLSGILNLEPRRPHANNLDHIS